jgi:hypothetical protein
MSERWRALETGELREPALPWLDGRMQKSQVVLASIVGLVLAIVSVGALVLGASAESIAPFAVASAISGALAAALAAAGVLGTRPKALPHVGIPFLAISAVDYVVVLLATFAYYGSILFADPLPWLADSQLLLVIIAAVLFVAASAFYRTAANAQGVPERVASAYTILLLLTVIPGINVLGLAIVLVTTLVRRSHSGTQHHPVEE